MIYANERGAKTKMVIAEREQDILNRDSRIEKLEIDKDDTETEINFIEQTIDNIESMKAELKPSVAKEQLELFLTTLKKEKEYNMDILQEITNSIEFVKTN